jgi:anti-sigma regulatory factor (Ser/Thr protein kinase)
MTATTATQTASAQTSGVAGNFRHQALFYSGLDDFVAGTCRFIREGIDAGEPALVVVGRAKIELLRRALGPEADSVRFADMADVGANPARIIPVWREFFSAYAGSGRRLRGIGEPIWASRSSAELVECQRHESLLNLAFADSSAWWLLCPYDRQTLDRNVLEEARCSHPFVTDERGEGPSKAYRGLASLAGPFDLPLAEPPPDAEVVRFEHGDLAVLRWFVWDRATSRGFSPGRAADLVLAVNEVATNSLRHATGSGDLRLWTSEASLICEISDEGHIDSPLVGRVRPVAGQTSGYGLWLANQLCDLVQVRSFTSGSAVRIHMNAG